MLRGSAVSAHLSRSRLGSVNRLVKFCCNTQVPIIIHKFSATNSSRLLGGSPRHPEWPGERALPAQLRGTPTALAPEHTPKGRGGTELATFPGAAPGSQPHFLNPCIVLAENPGGSHTGGGREEGRGRSWGKRMRRKRRRRKTTSSP